MCHAWLCGAAVRRASPCPRTTAAADALLFLSLCRSIFPDPAAPAKVPILIDGDVRLVESCVICEYLDQAYPTPPLLPSDAGTAARVRLFTELFSTHFTARLYGTFSAQNREQLDAAVEKLAAGLKVRDLSGASRA